MDRVQRSVVYRLNQGDAIIRRKFMKLRPLLLTLIFFIFSACTLPSETQPTTIPTIPPKAQISLTSSEIPTVKTLEIPDHAKYILDTSIDYDLHRVEVTETIQYPNQSGQELTSLTLAIAANLWADCFRLAEVTVDGTPVTGYSLNLHRLDLPLPTPLAPDSVSTVTLRYSLSLPYMDQVNSQRARIFGYSDIQMNLVNQKH